MKKAITLLLVPLCTVVLLSLLVTPQSRIQHQDSSAFKMALQQAVDRLEGGGKLLLAGTATPVAAAGVQQEATYDGRYTCETYEPAYPTCDPGPAGCVDHTADPQGHTCWDELYTCQAVTCDTYDPLMVTCDPNNADCVFPHTSEPAAFNHTCEGHTCQGTFTCDFTVDPRAPTCDAADFDCQRPTFDAFVTTCDPMKPECSVNNSGHCTAQTYPTCDAAVPTCDPADATCVTLDPTDPNCTTPTKKTTWGAVKAKYAESQ